MVHGCIHGCGAPAFLDHVDQQNEQLDNLAVHPRHHPYAHKMLPGVEGEGLLWKRWPLRVLQLLPSLCGHPLKLHKPNGRCDISSMCKCRIEVGDALHTLLLITKLENFRLLQNWEMKGNRVERWKQNKKDKYNTSIWNAQEQLVSALLLYFLINSETGQTDNSSNINQV